MTDEKKKRKGIGSISHFATLGNAQEPEHLDTRELQRQSTLERESQSTQNPRSLDVKTPQNLSTKSSSTESTQERKSSDDKILRDFDTKVSEDQESQEPKRFVQVSETELKRLMAEVLESQGQKTTKPKRPQRLRQTVYLEPELHNKIRHRIADTGEDISDVVNLALKQLFQGSIEGKDNERSRDIEREPNP